MKRLKRISLLLLCVVCLSACGSAETAELAEIQERIEALKQENAELQAEIDKALAEAGITLTPTEIPQETLPPEPTKADTEPTATVAPTPTEVAEVTKTPEKTATPKPTATNTPKPTATITPKPTATNTPKPTATNTPKPTATNTPKPTATNTPKPTATSTPTPIPVVTVDGPEGGSIVITMDAKEQMTKQEVYNASGKLVATNTVTYKSGKISAIKCKDAKGNAIGSVTYTYKSSSTTKEMVADGGAIAFVESVSDGYIEMAAYTGETLYFDREGNPDGRETYLYFENGSVKEEAEYDVFENMVHLRKYNESGTWIVDENWEYDSEGNLIEGLVSECYDDGTTKQRTYYNADEEISRYVKWNERGKKCEEGDYTYNSRGKLTGYRITTFNDAGAETGVAEYNGKGDMLYQMLCEYHDNGVRKFKCNKTYNGRVLCNWNEEWYDTSGIATESVSYGMDENGEMVDKVKSEYHKNGMVKKTSIYDVNDVLKAFFSYDKNGIQTEQEQFFYTESGALESHRVHTYDANGNDIGYIWYDGNGNVIDEQHY